MLYIYQELLILDNYGMHVIQTLICWDLVILIGLVTWMIENQLVEAVFILDQILCLGTVRN